MAPARGHFAKVCYESRHFLRVFSSSEISVIAFVTGSCWDGITETHKQLQHIHRNPGQENKLLLTLSLSLPLCFTLTVACMHKQSQSHTHTHSHKHPHTHKHTDLLPRYVHDLTPVSKVYEHRACCNAKFSTLSTHRLIPSLYTFELFLDFSGNYYS